MDAYRADRNPAKLDLGVGVYKMPWLTPIPPGQSSWRADTATKRSH